MLALRLNSGQLMDLIPPSAFSMADTSGAPQKIIVDPADILAAMQ
jgi:hypothetical protein